MEARKMRAHGLDFSTAPGKAQIRRAERFALISAALFVIGAALVARSGNGAVLDHLWALGKWPVVGLVALTMISLTARAARWHALTRELGIRNGWRDSFLCYVAGFAFTLTPGRLGEGIRLWIIRRGNGARYERTASLLIADRISDALAMVLVAAVAAWTFTSHVSLAVLTSLAVIGITVALVRPAMLLTGVTAAYALLRRWPRLFARLRTMIRQTQRLMSGRVFACSTLLVAGGWVAEALALDWLLQAMGANIGLLPVAFAFAVALIIGSLSMFPGGLGGTEATLTFLLLSQGVQLDQAVATIVVFRLGTLWLTIALAVLALPFALRTAAPPLLSDAPGVAGNSG